jgi:hypothetical protein
MWRNKSVFEEDFRRPNNPTQVILKMAMEIDGYEQTHLKGWTHQYDTAFIGWNQSQEGWIKLNCDDVIKVLIYRVLRLNWTVSPLTYLLVSYRSLN